jgi:hypothetical protein
MTPPVPIISAVNWAFSKQLPPKATQHPGTVPQTPHGPSGQSFAETLPTKDIPEPLSLLKILAYQHRLGALAPSNSPVKARTMKSAFCSFGQTIPTLGFKDHRLQLSGKLYIWLEAYYSKQDPPPNNVKPIPL